MTEQDHTSDAGAPVTSTVISPHTFDDLLAAWAQGGLAGLGDVTDTSGRTVLTAGDPTSQFQDLLSPLLHQRGCLTVSRSHATGGGGAEWIWMNGHGILHTRATADGVELTAESGGSIYRTLIDMLGLTARPAPTRGVDQVRVRQELLVQFADDTAGPEGPLQASQRIGEAVREQAPGTGECLRRGDATLVTLAAEWLGAEGDERSSATFIDTPGGMLLHSHDSGFLRKRHTVEPAPAWVIWAEIVARLPRDEDIALWCDEDPTQLTAGPPAGRGHRAPGR